jgi:hypothetical protein
LTTSRRGQRSTADRGHRAATPGPETSAARLLRWYPKAWRSRYGEEFAELLVADITERPRSRARALDVARGGVRARLAVAGLGDWTLDPDMDQVAQARTGLAWLACSLAVFLSLGAAMWSQLTIGWQWSAPDTVATRVATVLMSASMAAFAVLAVAAAVPVLYSRRVPRKPALLVLTGTLIMVTGARHFGNGWPGTGGHPWSGRGLVPGGVAAFSWASTLSVSSLWAHPDWLARFPAAELAWMAVSPIAIAAVVYGAVTIVRRSELTPRVLRFEARLGIAAAAVMTIFLAGCCAWVMDGGPGPDGLFHAGAIDVGGLLLLAIAFSLAHRAVTVTWRFSRS